MSRQTNLEYIEDIRKEILTHSRKKKVKRTS